MNSFEVTLYFVCFALIGGAAFAMMWANIQSINIEMRNSNNDRLERQRKYIESFHDHPEAPEPGEELMYVEFGPEDPPKYLESLEKLMQRESPWEDDD